MRDRLLTWWHRWIVADDATSEALSRIDDALAQEEDRERAERRAAAEHRVAGGWRVA